MTRYFWSSSDLRTEGSSRREIAAMLTAGALVPVRTGLHALPGTPPQLVIAARAGAAVTFASAARPLGVWTPPGDRLHLALAAGAGAPDVVPDACLHWSKRVPPARSLPDRVVPLPLALEHAVRCLPPEHAIAMIDSALHERRLPRSALAEIALALPSHLRPLLTEVDGDSDSGIESIARVRIRRAGLPAVVHAVLPGIGEVDLLVAGVLIVEIDGREFHTGDAFARDRHRDREATLQGYRVLRFTYHQVVHEWPRCIAAIQAALLSAGTR